MLITDAEAAALGPARAVVAGVMAESLGLGDVSLRPATYGAAGEFASVGQATSLLSRAQRDYERASLWLAATIARCRATSAVVAASTS